MKTVLSLLVPLYLTTAVAVSALESSPQLLVSLWHTWVDDAGSGVTVFWDSSTAPVLTDGPEFLHTRQTAPTGAAYEIDVTEDTVSVRAVDVSGVASATMSPGKADSYYLFVDDTAEITSAALRSSSPSTGVSVEIVPKGTELVVQDKSYPLDLDLQLEQDAVLITLGEGTPLDDESWEIVVDYVRVASKDAADPAQMFTEEDEDATLSSSTAPRLVLASLVAASSLMALVL